MIFPFQRGGGEETEERYSHNLQNGHPAWWLADNSSIFPTVNILREERSESAEEVIKRLKK